MKTSAKGYTSNTAVTTIDLATLSWERPTDTYEIGDFNIEVIDNDAVVSMQFVGPFPNSEPRTPEGTSTFAIGGATALLSRAAVGKLIFTRTGTTPYYINITKVTG